MEKAKTLTFKDLKKRVTLEAQQQQSRLFERLQNKPFWIWDKQQHKQVEIAALLVSLAYHKKMEMISNYIIMKK
jgi:hypothetical protein